MTLTANSNTVVDISGDNDVVMAQAAAATITPSNLDADSFERSCDNPECSAPKLISLVPKREIPEFITEPAIVNLPTLINGFTTVFQIDGNGHKMDDIMNGELGSSTVSGRTKPVFRIVPNTHAHIVNYVVVDSAGETMRKIKANDSDTMRKLLDSQRLSAEQMLKKLIEKAFKFPTTRPDSPPSPPKKIPKSATPFFKEQESQQTIPVQGDASEQIRSIPPGITVTMTQTVNEPQVQRPVKPILRPVIIKKTPMKGANINVTPTAAKATPVASKATPIANKATPVASTATPVASKTTPVASKATPTLNKLTPVVNKATTTVSKTPPAGGKAPQQVASKSPPVVVTSAAAVTKPSPVVTKPSPAGSKTAPSVQQPQKPNLPSVAVNAAQVQQPSKSELSAVALNAKEQSHSKPDLSPAQPAVGVVNTPKLIPKPIAALTNPLPSDSPRIASRLSKVNTSKPVIWQAVSPINTQVAGNSSNVDISSTTTPEEQPFQNQRTLRTFTGQSKTITPHRQVTTNESIIIDNDDTDVNNQVTTQTSTPHQANSVPKVYSTRLSTSNKPSAPSTTTPMETRKAGQVSFLKRKQDRPPVVKETIKKLRPRSPKIEMKILTPPAVELSLDNISSPPTKKLCALPKQQAQLQPIEPTISTQSSTFLQKQFSIQKAASTSAKEDEIITPDSIESNPNKNIESSDEDKQRISKVETTPPQAAKSPTKPKPLMGPASKMRAIKALAAAKAAALAQKNEISTRLKSSLASKTMATKIGDTTIRPASSVNLKEANPEVLTQPCSVSMTDVVIVVKKQENEKVVKRAITRAVAPKTPKKMTGTYSNLKAGPEEKIYEEEDVTPNKTQSQKTEPKITRSSTPKISATTKTMENPHGRRLSNNSIKSTGSECSGRALSNPSAPSRVLRVVLPSVKKTPPTTPVKSPHPNLKISSVMSGGSAVAAATFVADKPTSAEESESDMERMQKELADLRRTVERLTKKKA